MFSLLQILSYSKDIVLCCNKFQPHKYLSAQWAQTERRGLSSWATKACMTQLCINVVMELRPGEICCVYFLRVSGLSSSFATMSRVSRPQLESVWHGDVAHGNKVTHCHCGHFLSGSILEIFARSWAVFQFVLPSAFSVLLCLGRQIGQQGTRRWQVSRSQGAKSRCQTNVKIMLKNCLRNSYFAAVYCIGKVFNIR